MVVQASIGIASPCEKLSEANLASKKYVVVKNHVRELTSIDQEEYKPKENNQDIKIKQKVPKKRKIKRNSSTHTEDRELNSKSCDISEGDLEELRTVYTQCKTVLEKIESKYGHLLHLNNLCETQDKASASDELYSTEECQCNQNKKIVFDEEGKQISKDFNKECRNHICLKRHKQKPSYSTSENSNLNIQVEYESDNNADLPDSLHDLGNLLKEPDLKNQQRRKVINKIKGIRQEYINELRFDKQILVEKLKTNPEDLLDFKGTNLASLSGYPS